MQHVRGYSGSSSGGSPTVACPFRRRSSGFLPMGSASMLLSPRSLSPPLKSGQVLPVVPVPPDAATPPINAKQLLSLSASPAPSPSPDTENPRKVPEPEVPTLCCLLKHYWSWLLPPVLLLLLAVPGLYATEAYRVPGLALAVLAAAQLFTAAYFVARVARHVQALLRRLEGKVDLLVGCDAGQISSIVSGDERVRFLQLALYHRRSAAERPSTVGMDGDHARNPLHFLSLDLAARAKSEDGHCVVTSTGTILWCNDALASHFGYNVSDLLAENVRRLMPPPYSTMHDALMRKYDRESTTKRVVGCTRPVPVVDRAGVQHVVSLTVEERVDPTDEANALFLAKMVFPHDPSLLDLVRERMWTGLSAAAECQDLQGLTESFLITDARGDVLLASDRLATLLGWPLGQLEGHNLAVLMSPDTGGVHADYMWRYVQRASGGPPSHAPPGSGSGVVGAGRDLYARRADGRYVRAWVTVHRLDAPSGRPEDYRFLGTVLYVSTEEGGSQSLCLKECSTSPSRGSRRSASVAAGPGLASPALGPLLRKRCTVVTFDLMGVLDLPQHEVGFLYEAFLQLLAAACHRHNGQIQSPVGDRVLVTLNVAAPNLSQRTAAAAVLQHVTEEWGRSGCALAAPIYCAAVHAPALCAMYGRTSVLLGEAVDVCAALVRVAAEAHAQHGLIDAALYDELQYAYECRPVNRVTLWPKLPNARSMLVYEMCSLKEVDEDEWMYQIEPRQKADPLAHWRSCWDWLEGGPPTPRPGWVAPARPLQAAIASLACHLDDHPHDPTAAWLHGVLLQQRKDAEATLPVELAGKTPYTVHYRAPPMPNSPRTTRSVPRRTT